MINNSETHIILHGTMLNVDNTGVLLIGKAGSGKTEIALEMLTRHHRLISDDAVKFERVGDKLLAHKANTKAHQLHLRSIGIVDTSSLFDKALFGLSSAVDLVIQLTPTPDENHSLFPSNKTKTILGVELPLFSLYCQRHCPLSIILETLVKQFRLKHQIPHQQGIAT